MNLVDDGVGGDPGESIGERPDSFVSAEASSDCVAATAALSFTQRYARLARGQVPKVVGPANASRLFCVSGAAILRHLRQACADERTSNDDSLAGDGVIGSGFAIRQDARLTEDLIGELRAWL